MTSVALYDPKHATFCLVLAVSSDRARCFVSHLHCLGPDEILTRVTVVLGSPGSGCTTFLKMLANHRETYRDVQGEVFYDSLTPDEIRAHSRGDLQVRSSFPSPYPYLIPRIRSSSPRKISISPHSQWKKLSDSLQRLVPLMLESLICPGRTTSITLRIP